MIVFMLLGIFAVLGILLGVVAYTSAQRRRSGMSDGATDSSAFHTQQRAVSPRN